MKTDTLSTISPDQLTHVTGGAATKSKTLKARKIGNTTLISNAQTAEQAFWELKPF